MSVRSYVVRVDQGGSSIGFRVVREPISPEQLASQQAANSLRPIQGTIISDSGTIPEFEIQFVPKSGPTRVVKISGKEFSVLLLEGEYQARVSGLPKVYSVSVLSGPMDLTAPFLITTSGLIADWFTGVAMGPGGITVRLKTSETN